MKYKTLLSSGLRRHVFKVPSPSRSPHRAHGKVHLNGILRVCFILLMFEHSSYFPGLFWMRRETRGFKNAHFVCLVYFSLFLTWKSGSKIYPWFFNKTACQQNMYGKWGPPKIFYSLISKLNWDVENIWASPPSLSAPRISKGYPCLFCVCVLGVRWRVWNCFLLFFLFCFSFFLQGEKGKPDIFKGID